MKTNSGILYCLSNELWQGNMKIGLTTQKIEKRISNLQTSLFIDCKIIAITNSLVNCKIYEFLLKKILKEYRLRNDREFFNIDIETLKEIFSTFDYINSILDTEEKINQYMLNNHPEYFKSNRKRTYNEMCSSDSPSLKNNVYVQNKFKKRKGIYVDTSIL
jgi:hypothetical protein